VLYTRQHRLVDADCMLQENSLCCLPLAAHTIISSKTVIFSFYGMEMLNLLNAPYKMTATTSDKRTPITTPSYNFIPNVDVTPDPPTFSLDTIPFTNYFVIIYYPLIYFISIICLFEVKQLCMWSKGRECNPPSCSHHLSLSQVV
jgi:hypothetical protein